MSSGLRLCLRHTGGMTMALKAKGDRCNELTKHNSWCHLRMYKPNDRRHGHPQPRIPSQMLAVYGVVERSSDAVSGESADPMSRGYAVVSLGTRFTFSRRT